jgi:hypothetical protein
LMFLHNEQLEAEPEQVAQIVEHKLHNPLFAKYPLGQLLTHCDPINKNPEGQVKQTIPVLTSWHVAQGNGQIIQLPEI